MSFFGFLAGECEIHLTAYLFTNDGYQDVSLPPLLCLYLLMILSLPLHQSKPIFCLLESKSALSFETC
jgi:hypothetical protein